MSRWSDQYEKLPIHDVVGNAIEVLDFDVETLNVDAATEYRRLSKAFDFLRDVLANLDPELAPDGFLNSVSSHLKQNVVAQISHFVANKNVQHLVNANDQLSSQLATIMQLKSEAKRS